MLFVHYIPTVLSVIGSLIGIQAAYIWFKASRVSFISDTAEKSGDIDFANYLRVLHIIVSAEENGRLNKNAAILTAISVILLSFSSLIEVCINL